MLDYKIFIFAFRCAMTKELQELRKFVIPKLLKNPMALPFKYPVDAITEGIYPDYFMVRRDGLI